MISTELKLSDFDFDLPKELIAQTPAKPRDHARLLVYDRQSHKITDEHFYNLHEYLAPNTTLVLNDSKVEKARLRFADAEIFILKVVDPHTVEALVKPGKKFKPGTTVQIKLDDSTTLKAATLSADDVGVRTLKLNYPVDAPVLKNYRLTPLPPYITQNEKLSAQYQTVYARPMGSKAAPTAGLHFTNHQLEQLSKQHPLVKITLHVGLGTFAPIKNDIKNHKMHSEEYIVSAEAAHFLNKAQHITAVGTTSARTLESLVRPFKESSGATDIFITPGYEFKNVNSLITNFHLPKSTLLMLVAAMTGADELKRIYAHAIFKKYRFYSFGDAMLIN